MIESPPHEPSEACLSCPSRFGQLRKLGIRVDDVDYVAALAGNPNTGKTTVFNTLTGLRMHTGNWPGKSGMKRSAASVTPSGIGMRTLRSRRSGYTSSRAVADGGTLTQGSLSLCGCAQTRPLCATMRTFGWDDASLAVLATYHARPC